MSAVSHDGSSSQQPDSFLDRTFDAKTRHQLMEEDAAAWRAVCGVLLTIVSVGLLIGIMAVLLA